MTMIIRTRTTIDKDYLIKSLAYHLYRQRLLSLDHLSRKKALEIIRDSVWWCGRVGWTGDSNCVSDIIGEFEQMDIYNACYEKATEYVERVFPNEK